MILFDIALDIFIFIYTSLGFGIKEHKIETKMEKIGRMHPEMYQIYLEKKLIFEFDEMLSNKIISLDIKNPSLVHAFINEIKMNPTIFK